MWLIPVSGSTAIAAPDWLKLSVMPAFPLRRSAIERSTGALPAAGDWIRHGHFPAISPGWGRCFVGYARVSAGPAAVDAPGRASRAHRPADQPVFGTSGPRSASWAP